MEDNINDSDVQQGYTRERLEISPGLTKYWIPIVEQDKIPRIGMEFPSLQKGVQFYRDYGSYSGFDIRTSTTRRFRNKDIHVQYIVCNREGFKNSKVSPPIGSNEKDDPHRSSTSRTRSSSRVGCNARCIFQYATPNSYKIKYFEERHTHSLRSEPYRQFMKVNRSLNFGHQQFILNCTKANVGTAKTLRVFKEMVGGYSNVGALQIDFKNFRRDLRPTYVVRICLIIDKNLRKKK
ncbi:hypothetical protein DH2020_006513 [Rehmannia glutinosa]|uniref:FAR1 domain-containing protein n=1 Tax=Rehmannia glutinosa TaxID=99300 RepID=A0ABR0XJ17_REHGL